MSAALAPILIGVAAKIGAPIVKGLLEKFVGGTGAEIGGVVIDAIADEAGVKPDELPSAPTETLEAAISAVEARAPEIILAQVEQQRAANELQLAEMKKEGTWTWAWRPAWMWLLAFIWTYALVLRPIANAAFGASIEATDLATLMSLTLAYLALYMGGHTAKNFIKAKWK